MQADRPVQWFRRLALAAALLAAAVVVLGAWVRLTDAGLGCPDWPGCYGHLYPQVGEAAQIALHGQPGQVGHVSEPAWESAQIAQPDQPGNPAQLVAPRQSGAARLQFAKALHEMIHRYFASTLGLIIVSLLLFSLWNRKDHRQPLQAVALLFILVCLQGSLGALTVTLLLKPLIVTAHLLGGLTTLGLLWWLSLTPEVEPLQARDAALRPLALIALAAMAAQIALGGWTSTNYAAVACPDLPTCQQSWWPHMDFRDAFVLWRGLDIDYTGGVLANPARVAIQVTHRLGALVAGSILTVTGCLIAIRAGNRRLRRVGALLVCAVLLQIVIGVSMVHFGMPLPLATLHNAGAALLVVCMATLLRRLWPAIAHRQPSSLVLPLRHVHRTP